MRQIVTGVLLLCLLTGVAIAGEGQANFGISIDTVLHRAGENRSELERVLEHYSDDEDSLKLEAARFLIAGMGDHGYSTYCLTDTAANEITFDAEMYASYDQLLAAFDSLEEAHGPLEFERDKRTCDVNNITADFLIRNIDMAFRAWQERPWANFLSFDQFCNFVLPYRGSGEPLEPWRSHFWNRYDWVADSTDDPAEAARLINRDIRTWFGFDRRYYYHPTDQGLSEMLESGLGRCEDMTNLAIYAMRAVGLAVTSDYTPHWGNANNNHAWNAILLPEGEVVPFMGAEADPGEYTLVNRPAKVYRKTYAPQTDNLAFLDHKQEQVPRWLGGENYCDVTTAYVDARDVTLNLAPPAPDSIDIAYICVYNWGGWKAVHWGRTQGNSVRFTDMGPEILYAPAVYVNEKIELRGKPFLLHDDGLHSALEPAYDSLISMTLTHTTGTRLANSTDIRRLKPLKEGVEYELQCWDDGWQPLAADTAGDSTMVLNNIPAGALYRLLSPDSDGEQERPFTYVGGKQVWW